MYKTSKTSMSAARLPAGKVRQDFAETVNRVAYGGERVVLHRRGRNLAALIPLEDLARLEELEDRQDAEEARKALAAAIAKGEKPIPWAQAEEAGPLVATYAVTILPSALGQLAKLPRPDQKRIKQRIDGLP